MHLSRGSYSCTIGALPAKASQGHIHDAYLATIVTRKLSYTRSVAKSSSNRTARVCSACTRTSTADCNSLQQRRLGIRCVRCQSNRTRPAAKPQLPRRGPGGGPDSNQDQPNRREVRLRAAGCFSMRCSSDGGWMCSRALSSTIGRTGMACACKSMLIPRSGRSCSSSSSLRVDVTLCHMARYVCAVPQAAEC